MLFGLVYTRSWQPATADATPVLFLDWQPPLAFTAHWQFATGGGMGLVEAANSGEIEKAIAPFTAYFDFTLECVGEPVTSVERDSSRTLLAVGA